MYNKYERERENKSEGYRNIQNYLANAPRTRKGIEWVVLGGNGWLFDTLAKQYTKLLKLPKKKKYYRLIFNI